MAEQSIVWAPGICDAVKAWVVGAAEAADRPASLSGETSIQFAEWYDRDATISAFGHEFQGSQGKLVISVIQLSTLADSFPSPGLQVTKFRTDH